jgi:hypothetical protein
MLGAMKSPTESHLRTAVDFLVYYEVNGVKAFIDKDWEDPFKGCISVTKSYVHSVRPPTTTIIVAALPAVGSCHQTR